MDRDTEVGRPAPVVSADNQFFWEGVSRGELRIQRCAGCGRLRHPPRPMCPRCQSLDWSYVVSAGRGRVYSFVTHYRPTIPGFESPFVVALVQLDEGTRLITNLLDCEPGDVRIGTAVEVTFVSYADGVQLPQFRPAPQAG